MVDFVSLVLNSIDLQGYGVSPSFIGFFERSGKSTPEMADIAVDLFLKSYGGLIDELVIVSSLHVDTDVLGKSGAASDDKRDVKLASSLVLAGALRSISYDETFGTDYESQQYDAAVEFKRRDFTVFHVSDLELAVLRDLLKAKMVVYGLYGHCFILLEKLGLGFYPHSDLGFGVFALRENANLASAHSFLNSAGNLENFQAIIRR